METGFAADFIVRHWEGARKLVEVGVGRRPEMAQEIQARLPDAEVYVTDVDPRSVYDARCHGLRALLDDVFHPVLDVYRGADLIYARLPAPEMIPAILALSKWVHADLFLMTLDEDAQGLSEAWVPVRVEGRLVGWLRSASVVAAATSPRISQPSA